MRLLVTGAGGLIGSHLLVEAAELDHIELVATSRLRPADLPADVSFRSADLSNADEAAEVVRSAAPTHIIHTAWEMRHPTYWEDPGNMDWARAAGAMAHAFAEVGGRKFVQVGSCAEYDWSSGFCVEGKTPEQPTTLYGQSKLAAFHLIRKEAQGRFRVVEARIFFVFGPGENAARLIPTICRSHLSGAVPELGSGRQQRDLLFASDAASALLALTFQNGIEGVVNIGSGVPIRLAEVAEIVAGLAGAPESGLGRRPDRPGDPDRLLPDTRRLRSTGWSPQYSLVEGLAQTWEWWMAHSADPS